MSEVRLIVREAGHDWSGTVHGSPADRAIAALSADPVTLAELETAFARFEKPRPNHRFFSNLRPGLNDEPYDAGLVVIDLVARLVVIDSTYSSPRSTGEIDYHDGKCSTDTWLRYHLADDWLFTSDRCQWSVLAGSRRRERAARSTLDARAVFYGRPLSEFIAREIFAAYAQRETAEFVVDDTIKGLHANWLLTPRSDLGGACPREVALERHNRLEWDLQDQAERWSALQEPPPGLDESSFAFRYGGFGTHEIVLYYELVRELLWSCWDRLVELEKAQPIADGPQALTVGDFLASEVPRLESVRDECLDSPDPEFHGRTPRSIIARERARLPEGVSGHDEIVDPDCPCCQMMADMPGPVFWHLDGCNMDDDFAFDYRHHTREEWETVEREREEFHRRFAAEQEERKRLGLAVSGFGSENKDAVWSSSFSIGDTANVPLGVRLFGIGGHLAELIVDLNSKSGELEVQQFIVRLNRDFGNLRELLQNSEPSLVEPTLVHFTETLADIVSASPDLSAKCESLTNSLNQFLDRRLLESGGDLSDLDYPF
jgi:hypothetical protein